MRSLEQVSSIVLEYMMTDCLIKMEKRPEDDAYVEQQIFLFKLAEKELKDRRLLDTS